MPENKYQPISYGIHYCAPDWEWRSKGFEDYDLWAVFGGDGCIALNGREYKVTAGSCVLIPPHTDIHGRQDPCKRLEVCNVHFKFMNGKKEKFPYGIEVRRISDVLFFKSLFERTVGYGNMSRSDLSCACIDILLNEFFSSPRDDGEGRSPAEAEHIRCISKICGRINEAPETCVSLSSLALELGYSATYLGKLFHKIMGVGFSDYLANARINRAKMLLVNTEMSVAEIAQSLGYYDPCHFVKQFKKYAGCTPRNFK